MALEPWDLPNMVVVMVIMVVATMVPRGGAALLTAMLSLVDCCGPNP